MTDLALHNLFFALWPDETVRTGLAGVQQGCSGSDGRMHHALDLHMTLVFLGRVSSEQFACVRSVAASITVEPFSLEFTRTGYWKRPRILWCGPERVPDLLQCLVNDLHRGLTQCGFEPEQRTYKPHVTLARKAGSVPEQLLDEPIVWRPEGFVLAGSNSGAKPPRYHILDRWGLRA